MQQKGLKSRKKNAPKWRQGPLKRVAPKNLLTKDRAGKNPGNLDQVRLHFHGVSQGNGRESVE